MMSSLVSEYCGNLSMPNMDRLVYKEECVYSLDTPDNCPRGLFISLSSYVGVGHHYLPKYHLKTADPFYLNFRRVKKPKNTEGEQSADSGQPTKMAIGVQGGFSAGAESQFEFEDHFKVYLLPEDKYFETDSDLLPELVRQNVKHVQEASSARASNLPLEWDGEKRAPTTVQLVQLDNGKKIGPSGWKCERCDLTSNLWLNLTDGAILCGRKFFDGTGGNNHAIDYYKDTGYPLAVKLGTITAQGRGDVFSYVEDDMVELPGLKSYLSHFGINVENVVKSDKTMAEMEIELNQTYEWKLLTEAGSQLERLFGGKYTGMRNLGNTCYIASVMQALFHIPQIANVYLTAFPSLVDAMSPVSEDIHTNISFQIAKLFNGLRSGDYSTKEMAEKFIEGVSPMSFKRCAGRNHHEFRTSNQQDVQEFMLHLFSLVEKSSRIFGHEFTKDFQFTIQEKLVLSDTNRVRYDKRNDNMLSLFVPMDRVSNSEDVKRFESLKEKYQSEGKDPEISEIVIPKVPMSELLNNFTEKQTVESVNGSNTYKQASLLTFPKLLLVHVQRFTMTKDWRPAKLEVSIDMPETLDISQLRAGSRPQDEELIEESTGTGELFQSGQVFLSSLMSMGFSEAACKRACYNTKNAGLEQATNWLMEHLDDSDLNTSFTLPGESVAGSVRADSSGVEPSEESIALVMSMGFERIQALNALRSTDNNVERAVDWIFSYLEASTATEPCSSCDLESDPSRGGAETPGVDSVGSAKYKLLSFISHMGPSAACGHYVVHIKIDDKWVLFNDEKVAISSNLPKDLGYVYVYERVPEE